MKLIGTDPVNAHKEIAMDSRDNTFFSLEDEQSATDSGGPYYTEWPHARFTSPQNADTKQQTVFGFSHPVQVRTGSHDSINR